MTQAPAKRITLPVLVGVVAGLVSVTVGSLTIYTFFVPKPDERFAQMISTADGMKNALERIAETVEAQPELIGSDVESAKALAVSANSVTESVQLVAKSKGIAITSTDLWGERFFVKSGKPIMLSSPSGQMFGVANAQFSGLNIYNNWYSASDGAIIEFNVKNDKCSAFVHTNTNEALDVTVRCEG